ncbi:hypothetical protein FC831_15295 [Clostridium botulinum]|nr:hypothetical protein [Clostridium botulinum]
MKTLKSVLKGLIILTIGITTLGAIELSPVQADTKTGYNNNIYVEFNILDSYTTEDNGQLTEYSDGSFAYVDTFNNIYEFTPTSLGDWNYSFDNIGDLNKCILSYASCLNDNKSNCLYITNSYINDEGDTIVEYNDYSYTVVNYNDNYFEFVLSCTEDWSLYFKDIKDLNNCIATYKSIKETGMY